MNSNNIRKIAVIKTVEANADDFEGNAIIELIITERQAQLPRTWVERLLNTVQQRGRRSKTDAWLLGVSCSVLFGLFCFW